MRQIEIYDTFQDLNLRADALTYYYTQRNIAHALGVLPFNNKFMLYIYAEDDIMKYGCLECITKHILHFSQVMNEIEYMEDDPKYGTRFIIEYNRETNDYELTYYKMED